MTEGSGRLSTASSHSGHSGKSSSSTTGDSEIPIFDSPDASYGWILCQKCLKPQYLSLSYFLLLPFLLLLLL